MTFLQERTKSFIFYYLTSHGFFYFSILRKSPETLKETSATFLFQRRSFFSFFLNHPSTPKPSTNQRAILLACLLLPSVGAVMNYQVKASTAYLPADFLWFQLSFQQLERCDLRIWRALIATCPSFEKSCGLFYEFVCALFSYFFGGNYAVQWCRMFAEVCKLCKLKVRTLVEVSNEIGRKFWKIKLCLFF